MLSFSQTQFAPRMLFNVGITDPFPMLAIAFPGIFASSVLLIVLCHQAGMFLTVSSISESWTSGVGTGPFRFVRHVVFLLDNKKDSSLVSLSLDVII